jgi:hypothetical protein
LGKSRNQDAPTSGFLQISDAPLLVGED